MSNMPPAQANQYPSPVQCEGPDDLPGAFWEVAYCLANDLRARLPIRGGYDAKTNCNPVEFKNVRDREERRRKAAKVPRIGVMRRDLARAGIITVALDAKEVRSLWAQML